MPVKNKRVRGKTYMITQQLDPENFAWTAVFDETTKINRFSTNPIATDTIAVMILSGLESYLAQQTNGNHVTNVFYILHDKDKHPDGTLKEPHIHLIVTFASKIDRRAVADCAGVAEQYVESPKQGRYGLINMLSYLIHAKDAQKYQYDPSEVHDLHELPDGTTGVTAVTNELGGYTDVYRQHSLEWAKGRASKVRTKTKGEDIDWLESEILAGKLTEKQILLTDDLYTIASLNWRRVQGALEVYAKHKTYKALDEFEQGKYQLTTLFVTGKPGSGKTFIAKKIINELQTRHPSWEVFQGAGSNPVDGYRSEEIMFLDDLRGNSMLASDWLKIMDPINNSTVSARYMNVKPVQRVLIITSYQDATTFFSYAKSAGDEALSQFIRRISSQVKVLEAPDMQDLLELGYKWDDIGKQIPNPFFTNADGTPRVSYAPDTDKVVNAQHEVGPVARLYNSEKLPNPELVTVTNGRSTFTKSTEYGFRTTGVLKVDDAVKALADTIDDRNEDLTETIEADDIHSQITGNNGNGEQGQPSVKGWLGLPARETLDGHNNVRRQRPRQTPLPPRLSAGGDIRGPAGSAGQVWMKSKVLKKG